MSNLKRVLCLVLCAAVALTLVGCAAGSEDNMFGNAGWVMKVGGQEVPNEEFLTYVLGYKYAYSDPDTGEIDVQLDEYVISYAESALIEKYTLLAWAKELDIELTDEEKQEVKTGIDEFYAGYETEEELMLDLDNNYYTKELFEQNEYERALANKLTEFLLSDEGPFPQTTDDEIQQYFTDYPFFKAKHILIMADGSGEDRARAEDVLNQLQGGADFDTLMFEYSEDTGLESNPEGYMYQAGTMVAEFEAAVESLEYGEISDIVESTYGYHIIMRLDPDMDGFLADNEAGLRDHIRTIKFSEELAARKEAISIEYYEGYETLSLYNLYWGEKPAYLSEDVANDGAAAPDDTNGDE